MEEISMAMDRNGNPVPVVALQDPQDVNGTSASTQSAAITGSLVRIISLDNTLRVAFGDNPTAGATGIAIPPMGELWHPIQSGHKVAVMGGKANICTAK